MAKRILFLDIDGVLRSSQSKKYYVSKGLDNKNFCPIACSNLLHFFTIFIWLNPLAIVSPFSSQEILSQLIKP